MKGDAPNARDIHKATLLAAGSGLPVLIAIGAPWMDSPYLVITPDDYEEKYGPFEDNPDAIRGYFAARGARFEFGETPVPQRLFA